MKHKAWQGGWREALAAAHVRATPHVLVSIVATRGSTPRASGAKMVVTADDTYDTIGGGKFEFTAIKYARTLLEQRRRVEPEQHNYTLGADMSQCCGGQLTLMYEVLLPLATRALTIFGAGHVTQALLPLLVPMGWDITCCDSRDEFVDRIRDSHPSVQVQQLREGYAQAEVCATPLVLVMTHDHALDLEICEASLARSTLQYCGLIASASKATRFRRQLHKRGFSDSELGRLVAPVGIDGITAKDPHSVAISIAAQLLQQQAVELKVAQGRVQPPSVHASAEQH